MFKVPVICGTELEREIELSRDGSHYSLTTGILPSLGARSNRRVQLRNFIISPYSRWYRYLLFRYFINFRRSVETVV